MFRKGGGGGGDGRGGSMRRYEKLVLTSIVHGRTNNNSSLTLVLFSSYEFASSVVHSLDVFLLFLSFFLSLGESEQMANNYGRSVRVCVCL